MLQAPSSCPSCHSPVLLETRCPVCGALLETHGFRVEALLAAGPRGRVYRASGQGVAVALKEVAFADVPDVATLERFEQESALLRSLSHPRIPEFIAAFSEGDVAEKRFYLAQRDLAGENLAQRRAHHYFDEREARQIAADVLEVLAYLHGRSPQLIHRDVKPDNVIALESGGYALVDFGSVRDRGREPGPLRHEPLDFGYLPPDQLPHLASVRSDLHALGVTLAQLLSRREVIELFDRDLKVEFERWVNVSDPFSEFIARLVARDPGRRFASAKQALRTLGSLPSLNLEEEEELTRKTHLSAVPPPSEPRPERGSVNAPAAAVQPARARVQKSVLHGVPWMLTLDGSRVSLCPGGTYVLGRGSSTDVRVPETTPASDTVSRLHLELEVTAKGLRVTDLESSNGTWVGAVALHAGSRSIVLTEGTAMVVGKVRIQVAPDWRALQEPAAAPRPVPAPQPPSRNSNHVQIFCVKELMAGLRRASRGPPLTVLERKVVTERLEAERLARMALADDLPARERQPGQTSG